MSSSGTALPSKQEKYLPTCMLGPLRWSMPESTKSDAKLSEIYEDKMLSYRRETALQGAL